MFSNKKIGPVTFDEACLIGQGNAGNVYKGINIFTQEKFSIHTPANHSIAIIKIITLRYR
jgi:hypothetical protein